MSNEEANNNNPLVPSSVDDLSSFIFGADFEGEELIPVVLAAAAAVMVPVVVVPPVISPTVVPTPPPLVVPTPAPLFIAMIFAEFK